MRAPIAAVVASVLVALGSRAPSAPEASPRVLDTGPRMVLSVPRALGDVTLDGDLDDPAWVNHGARTGPFVGSNGAAGAPVTQIRAIYSAKYLYLALFAADGDIRGGDAKADGPLWLGDSFRLELTKNGVSYALDVSPKGVITDARRVNGGAWDYTWQSDARTSFELDGTADTPTDFDEEWVIEMAIPFEAIGLSGDPGERIDFWARRCDRPSNVCLSWGEGAARGEIVLE